MGVVPDRSQGSCVFLTLHDLALEEKPGRCCCSRSVRGGGDVAASAQHAREEIASGLSMQDGTGGPSLVDCQSRMCGTPKWNGRIGRSGGLGAWEDGMSGGRELGRLGARSTGGRELGRTGAREDGRSGGRELRRTGVLEDGTSGGREVQEDRWTRAREDGSSADGSSEEGGRGRTVAREEGSSGRQELGGGKDKS
jgi:hypothetical protein